MGRSLIEIVMPGEKKLISFISNQHSGIKAKLSNHTVKNDEPELRRKDRTKIRDLSVLPT